MTYWFGASWGAPCCEVDLHVVTPVGSPCMRCKEPILDGAQGVGMPVVELDGRSRLGWWHLHCYLKGILPHDSSCPHCCGVELHLHAPSCGMHSESGLCDCQPMLPGGELTSRVALRGRR